MAVVAAWTRVGIDIGSARTVAVVCRNDGYWEPLTFHGELWLPSGVYRSGTGRVLTGGQAMEAALADPSGYLPDPAGRISADAVPLGGDPVPSVQLVAAVVRHVLDEAARVCGGPLPEVVVVVPPGWGPPRRALLRQAAQYAGVREPVLVPAAVAVAAEGTGVDMPVAGWTVICDLGAHAAATVIQRTATGYEVLAEMDADAAGDRIDDVLTTHLRTGHPTHHPDQHRDQHRDHDASAVPDNDPGSRSAVSADSAPEPGGPSTAVKETPHSDSTASSTATSAAVAAGPVGTGMTASQWLTRMTVRAAKEATTRVPAVVITLPKTAAAAGESASDVSSIGGSAADRPRAPAGDEAVVEAVVVTAARVWAAAAPVVQTAAELVQQAVKAAEVPAETGHGLVLVGGTAAIAGIGEQMQAATGLTVHIPSQPALATVRAAAGAGRYEAPEPPPPGLDLAAFFGVRSEVTAGPGVATDLLRLPPWSQLFALVIPTLASLLLAVQAIAYGYVQGANWYTNYPGYLSVNEGQLAMAAVLAVVTATAIGGYYTAPPRPAQPPTGRHLPDGLPTAAGMLTGAGLGMAVAALYAALGAAYHDGGFVGQLMPWTLIPAALVAAVVAVGALLVLRGAPEPRTGWGPAFTVPHPPIVLASAGMATITWAGHVTDPWTHQQWWFPVVPHAGGTLLGVATAYFIADRRLFQIAAAAPLAIITFLLGSFGPDYILGVMWVVTLGWWCIRRVWQIGTYGIPDNHHPDTGWT